MDWQAIFITVKGKKRFKTLNLGLIITKDRYIYVICRPGGPYWEKLCQRSWDKVFRNTYRPRPANNVFIIFFPRVLCKQFLCWIFTAAICKPGVRVRLTFRKMIYPIHTEIFAPKINEINFIPGRTVFVTSEKYRPTNHRPRTALCH